MTKPEELKLKKQDRAKWRRIVKDLCSDKPKLEVKLGCSSCGYCLIQGITGEIDPCRSVCRGCCLSRKSLCNSGMGTAYFAVNYYYFCRNDNHLKALEGAIAIFVAIERDIEKDG